MNNALHYTNERNVQIVLYLLKAHGVRKVVASPGTTNMTFVGSVQQDPFFEVYSAIDERSAAYIACGLAAESGEPVVLSCTGATASRNYYPGLTEAFYRKLPLIAVTSTQDPARVGQLAEQVIDRSQCAKDIVVCSEQIQYIEAASDEWNVTIKVNRALHALRKHGGGPVHLNLETRYSSNFSVEQLPPARVIDYVGALDTMPSLPKGRVAVAIGSHRPMSKELTQAIDRFCKAVGGVVFCSHVSNYKGAYAVGNTLIATQDAYRSTLFAADLLILIGEVTGGDTQMGHLHSPAQWRVSEDGEIRDLKRQLTAVFEMPEQHFFDYYASHAGKGHPSADEWVHALRQEDELVRANIPDVPFSNIWMAQQTLHRLPEGCMLHLGILNTLRSWNFFHAPASVSIFSNTGGFGIDGIVSSLIGASLASPQRLCFGVVGDLAFFYDLNCIGNRHVGANVRLLLINNGRGVEFRNPYHPCTPFGEDADPYMAAARHNGYMSHKLIKHFAQDLGYEYLSASNKEEYLAALERFVTPELTERPMLFEVFTETEDERTALSTYHHLARNVKGNPRLRDLLKRHLSPRTIAWLKRHLR